MSPLKFLALSGTTSVTENCYVYEYGDEMILVDCGVGFPEADMYGVDLVIPDFTYIRKNAHKLKAVVITHGHEDHLGAVPFLLKEFKVPVYGSPLTMGFVKDKINDYKMKGADLRVFNPEKDTLTIGVFKITPFRVSHSVPDACGLCIDTPEGKMFHVPDYKFDWTPVDGRPFDLARVALLASGGVLALASDALGSTSPGHTQSERAIEGIINRIISDATGLVYFSTISSNISRMQQAINAAMASGRKVCFVGRSIMRKTDIAKKLRYMNWPQNSVVPLSEAAKLPRDKVVYIIGGAYGQPGSALYRVAMREHDNLSVSRNDTVVFSADPAPPGAKQNVDFLVDRLLEEGIDVHYYDMQEDLHVSGHGCQEDIKFLMGVIRSKYVIPIGGTIRHMRAYSDIAVDMGYPQSSVLELVAGESVEYSGGKVRKGEKFPVKEVLVDGLDVGDVGQVVLRDRQILATDGIAIIVITFDTAVKQVVGDPEIISRGFVFEKKRKNFLEDSSRAVGKYLSKKRVVNTSVAKREAVNFLERYFFEQTGRRPMILPVVVEE